MLAELGGHPGGALAQPEPAELAGDGVAYLAGRSEDWSDETNSASARTASTVLVVIVLPLLPLACCDPANGAGGAATVPARVRAGSRAPRTVRW